MTTEMLEAIWKNPDDRDLLAVYADWLGSSGQTSRAEYMQLALLDNPTAAQERRIKVLRAKDRGKWLGKARSSVWTWEEDWNALLPHLELTPGWNPEAWVTALLASPVVRTLRTLTVPAWLDKPLQARLKKAVKQVTFRKQRRLRYNRETGYYF